MYILNCQKPCCQRLFCLHIAKSNQPWSDMSLCLHYSFGSHSAFFHRLRAALQPLDMVTPAPALAIKCSCLVVVETPSTLMLYIFFFFLLSVGTQWVARGQSLATVPITQVSIDVQFGIYAFTSLGCAYCSVCYRSLQRMWSGILWCCMVDQALEWTTHSIFSTPIQRSGRRWTRQGILRECAPSTLWQVWRLLSSYTSIIWKNTLKVPLFTSTFSHTTSLR